MTNDVYATSEDTLDSIEPIDEPRPASNSLVAPPPYNELRHVKNFLKAALSGFALVMIGIILVLASLVVPFITDSPTIASVFGLIVGILFIPAGVFIFYRERFRWRAQPITCDPSDGLLHDHQAESRWLAIRGSAPDPYSVDDMTLYTPKKTWPELLIFRRSQTLQLKRDDQVLVELTDVLDVERLLDIQRYRQSLQIQEVRQEASAADDLHELRRINTESVNVFSEILATLQRIEQHLNPAASPPPSD